MKIKNLLLLGLLTMTGMNAFAVDAYVNSNGVRYKYNDEAIASGAKVFGVLTATNAEKLTIVKEITVGDATLKVVGFEADWYMATGEQDIRNGNKELTIDITNFTAPFGGGTFSALTNLESLTLKGTSTINGDYFVPAFTNAKLKTLNYADLAAKSGKKLTLDSYENNAVVESITVPAAMEGVYFKGSTNAALVVTGVKLVSADAFKNSKVKTVTLAEGATIGDNAFEKVDNADFSINMGVATEIGKEAFKGSSIKSIDLAAAKKVGANAFQATTVETVTIPAQVEEIADNAFANINGLKTVNINLNNDKATTIGAWFNESSITALTINAPKVTAIAGSAFAASPIETLTFTDATALTSIGTDAFASYAKDQLDLSALTALTTVDATSFKKREYTSVNLGGTKLDNENFGKAQAWLGNAKGSLTAITLPETITKLGGFANFTELTSITIPAAVTEIEASAFKSSGLTNVVIPAAVTSIGESAFEYTPLETVNFSGANALATIGHSAFASTKLAEVKIPATLAAIDIYTFANNTELAKVDFTEAAKLTEIKDYAFNNDPKLEIIDLTGATKLATVTDKSFPKNAYKEVYLADAALDDVSFPIAQQWLTSAKGSLTKITLPEGLTTIDGFDGFTALEGIGLPKSVVTIEDNAFDGCTALKGIKIKKNVETIGEYAFHNCTALARVNLEEATALTDIQKQAFADCSALTSIDFAGATKLATIGESAFNGAGLTTVKVTGSITSIGKYAFKNNVLESIDFDDAAALTTIDEYAFAVDDLANSKFTTLDLHGATALTTVYANSFPKNNYEIVKTAGTALTEATFNAVFDKDEVLANAKESLTEITFPKEYNVTSFDNFSYFTKLATIALPEGITEIPAWAFAGSNFTSFTVPATVTKIGVGAFQTCAQLANVDFSQATALTEMGEGVFANCTALTAVGLPKNLEALPKDAFKNSGLTGIKIKNKVATIGESAFQGCANLAAVNFSEATALTEIGLKAFADCPKLAAVDFAGATALTTIGESAFNNDALTTVKVTASIETIGDQAFYNNKLESVDFTEAAALTTIGANAFGVDVAENSKLTAIDLDGATALTTVANNAFPKNKYTSVKTAGTKLAYTDDTVDPAVYYDNFSGFGGGLAPFTKDNILEGSEESLTELTFPVGYKMNGYDDDLAFFKNLTSISLPADLTEIPDDAFKGSNISSFEVGENIKRIGKRAFRGSKLESIDFTKATSLETIDNYAFADTKELKAVGLPKSLKVLNENVFENSALKGVKIKSQIKTISACAFRNAAALTQVNFEDARSLEKILGEAFAGTALTEIDLDGATALTEVAADAFPQNAYTSVLLAGTALDDAAFAAPFATILGASKTTLEEITLPQGLTEIANDQFNGFEKLTAIGLPKGVTKIGERAFMASGLKGIKIKKNVTSIERDAFKDCVNLAAVNMSEADALTYIKDGAFMGCYAEDADGNPISGLTSIVIPANVKEIGAGAFTGCALLANADFSQAAALEKIGMIAFNKYSDGIVSYPATAITSVDLSACAKLATIVADAFPANEYTSVKLGGTILTDASFKNFDFSGATATLAELTLPETITEIPKKWFGETMYLDADGNPQPFSALTTVAIPEGVVTIDDQAFQGAALATVDFSAATALETIGTNAFQKTAIAEVAIPANADDSKTLTIKVAAFADCANLTSFTAESWAGALANRLFQNCVSLPSIEIPAAITSVGNRAFEDCENLATVTFKHAKKNDKLTNIGNYAFRNCAALTALDLSKTKLVNLDSKYPFEGCTALAEITFPDGLLTINSDGIFADAPIENFEAPSLESCGVLFGEYRKFDDEDPSLFLGYSPRDKDNANTTLKSVKIGGSIPSGCFAFCTALEDVEWFDNGVHPLTVTTGTTPVITYPVDEFAFLYCTSLKTFTYQPANNIEDLMVDDEAFIGCTPYVLFGTNSNYLDYVATWHKGAAPVNTTFGNVEITKVQTVQDKANASQFVAKYVNNGPQPVYIDANEAKVYSIYVDGDKAYFQACRTYDGKYIVQPQSWDGYPFDTRNNGWNSHVIIVTNEAKEIAIHRMFLNELYDGLYNKTSIGHDDVYDSQADDDLARVQYNAMEIVAGVGQNYLYRLTNTSGVGFGFTAFTGTTIKEGQFFIACSRKPNGAGRLASVWLDEDGNVESETTGIESVESNGADNDAIYNMQGVRVEKAQKGVYIQNGKKIVVK